MMQYDLETLGRCDKCKSSWISVNHSMNYIDLFPYFGNCVLVLTIASGIS